MRFCDYFVRKKRQNFPATFFTNVSRTKITEFRLYTWFPSSNNTATERSDHAAAQVGDLLMISFRNGTD